MLDNIIQLVSEIRTKNAPILSIIATQSDFTGAKNFEDGKYGIYMFHGPTQSLVPYPYEYEAGEINAEMLLFWGKEAVLDLIIDSMFASIKEI